MTDKELASIIEMFSRQAVSCQHLAASYSQKAMMYADLASNPDRAAKFMLDYFEAEKTRKAQKRKARVA